MTLRTEFGRKVIHLGSSVFPITYWFVDKEIFLPIIGALALGTVVVDYTRHHFPKVQKIFYSVFGNVLRDDEESTLSGGSTVMIAEFLMIAFFPKPIAVASLLTLSIGDTAAAIIGITYGKHNITKNKTWEGTLAFLVSATIVASLVPGIPLYAAGIAAVIAGVMEVILSAFDDNVVIPLTAGLTLVLLLSI